MTIDIDHPTTPDIPLLRKVVEWAEEEAAKPPAESRWYQSNWATELSCGTAFCIAGKVVSDAYAGRAELVPVHALSDAFELRLGGVRLNWHEQGRDLLGLDDDQAYRLFDEHNTIADVRALAEEIAAAAGDRL